MADGPPVPQRSWSPPSPHWRSVQGQPRFHAGVSQNAVLLPANAPGNGNHRPGGNVEGIPLPVENIAARGQPPDLRYVDMGDHEMAHYRPPLPADMAPPHEYHRHDVNNYAGVPQDVAAQGIAPVVPAIDVFGYPAQQATAGPARAVPDGWPHQGPVPNQPAPEVLRWLASRYLYQPDSQVEMVSLEPDLAGGIRVVIKLRLVDL
ncbi:hypothetical protein BC826DRAFT_1100375 [Russula brevipes]|nr:hypothetical protein BC826DRAFT_1100375 [Russula brevipes]